MTTRIVSAGKVAFALGLTLAAVGCKREQIDEHVDKLKQAPQKIAEEVRDGVEDAKGEAARLTGQLPPADDVKEDLSEAGAKLKEKLRTAGKRVKSELERAKDDVVDHTSH
jgi:chromosome segregation ATPase